MAVRVTLDTLIVAKGIKARDLAAQVGLSETQLSLFRSGKVKASALAPWAGCARPWAADQATCWTMIWTRPTWSRRTRPSRTDGTAPAARHLMS